MKREGEKREKKRQKKNKKGRDERRRETKVPGRRQPQDKAIKGAKRGRQRAGDSTKDRDTQQKKKTQKMTPE